MSKQQRKLADLVSVGPATLQDLAAMGIHTVEELAKREPDDLYRALEKLEGKRPDPCALDVFTAAVAQARDPKLPMEKRQWWYWSRVRKGQIQA